MLEVMLRLKAYEDDSCITEFSPEMQKILRGPMFYDIKQAGKGLEHHSIPTRDFVAIGKALKDYWNHLPCAIRYL